MMIVEHYQVVSYLTSNTWNITSMSDDDKTHNNVCIIQQRQVGEYVT